VPSGCAIWSKTNQTKEIVDANVPSQRNTIKYLFFNCRRYADKTSSDARTIGNTSIGIEKYRFILKPFQNIAIHRVNNTPQEAYRIANRLIFIFP
jgi:hypothetical protein